MIFGEIWSSFDDLWSNLVNFLSTTEGTALFTALADMINHDIHQTANEGVRLFKLFLEHDARDDDDGRAFLAPGHGHARLGIDQRHFPEDSALNASLSAGPCPGASTAIQSAIKFCRIIIP